MYKRFLDRCKKITVTLERKLSTLFEDSFNPLYFHGALPTMLFWAVILSGVFLFFYYSPTIERAYTSVEYISQRVPYGLMMRGFHRYSADAMMLFVLIHMLRVYFTDRHREYRHVPWITGVVLLLLTLTVGATGYFLIWDERAVTLLALTVDFFNGIGLPWVSHFIQGGPAMNDLTLARMLFFHIAIPGTLFVFLWLHLMRISRPIVLPPAMLTLLSVGILFLVAGLLPVELTARATYGESTSIFVLDWFFLPFYYIYGLMTPTGFLIFFAALTAALLILPYIAREPKRIGAVVHETKCTGCQLCYLDCPYAAITMIPDPHRPRKLLAKVSEPRCTECGICVGACPFDAIELTVPGFTDKDIERQLVQI